MTGHARATGRNGNYFAGGSSLMAVFALQVRRFRVLLMAERNGLADGSRFRIRTTQVD